MRTYDRYGTVYLGAWVLALSGLAGLVHARWQASGPRLRCAWTGVLGALTVVAVGILGDYALPDDVDGGVGFLLTGLGFLAVLVAFPVLGWALRVEGQAGLVAAWGVGVLGVVAVVGGLFLVGHIPSGPGAGLALLAVVTAAGWANPSNDET